jgi:peroxiredoxin/YHS domain-containing protein
MTTFALKAISHVLCALILSFAAGSAAADDGALAAQAVASDEKAICHVCRVHEGETDAEPVVATAEHEGQTYGFCSTKCRDTFVEAPASYLPPVFPRPAPAFVVHDLDGAEVSLKTFRGKTVLLDFWATWCQPCVDDLPRLTALHERYRDDGVVVLSVSTDEGDDAPRKVRRMVKRRNARHPVYLDATESPAWASYLVRVVPTQFLIDAEGRIVAQWSGKSDLDKVAAEIDGLIDAGSL